MSLVELRQAIKKTEKKAPGYYLITRQIVKELQKKALLKFVHLINVALRLLYVPRQWKVAEVIMAPKTGKSPNDKK